MSTKVVDRLLHAHGFELCRTKKHKVYKRHDGKVFVRSKTPSDVRAEQNDLAGLCRMLGIKKMEVMESLRRPKREPRSVLVEDTPPLPATATPLVPIPFATVVSQPSREDRRLAKRLARIERNEAAKQAKFTERWNRLLTGDAILYMPTNEFEFLDLGDLSGLRRLEDLAEDVHDDEGSIADALHKTGELTTMPQLVIHLRTQAERLLFVFEDGSAVIGKIMNGVPQRIRADSTMTVRKKT